MDLANIMIIVQWKATCSLCTLWQRFGRAACGGQTGTAILKKIPMKSGKPKQKKTLLPLSKSNSLPCPHIPYGIHMESMWNANIPWNLHGFHVEYVWFHMDSTWIPYGMEMFHMDSIWNGNIPWIPGGFHMDFV